MLPEPKRVPFFGGTPSRNGFLFLIGWVWLMAVHTALAQTNFSIYSDQLNNGFDNWSWGTNNNFANTSPVHAGNDSIAFASETWAAISFHHGDFNPSPYTNLDFWANGGAFGGQIVQISVEYDDLAASGPSYQLPPFPTNSWRQFSIPLRVLGMTGVTNIDRITFQLTASGNTAPFYLDDVNLSTVPPATVHLQVNVTNTIRAADSRWLGLNTAIWDSNFDTATTSNALAELGTRILRFPGGSGSDEYHWATGKSLTNTWAWGTSFGNFMHIATNLGAQAIITVNYGTGTPAEAASWVRSANVTNHCNFKYWEVGNENYGTWETDSNTYPHDPYTYASNAVQFITQMKAADPTIKIGVPVVTGEDNNDNGYGAHPAANSRTGISHNGWTPVVLATMKAKGVLPDFLVFHVYPEYGNPSDQSLLQASDNWAHDAADLRQQLIDYVGSSSTNIELFCTENNSDAGSPQTRQSTSIVNGLYLADSLAHLMKTEFNSYVWWDLRNGQDPDTTPNSPVYGWRGYGDIAIIGNLNTRYPTFYTFELVKFFARPGDTVLDASSDYLLLPAYASRKADGSLAVFVINKDNATTFNAQLSLANYLPWTNALVRSFGMAQDEATRTNSLVPGARDIGTNNLAVTGTNLTISVPPYTATLLTIPPAQADLTVISTNEQTILQVQGQSKVRYILQSSSDLNNWTSFATNTLSGTTWNVTNNSVAPVKFWRAVWLPQ
jgi:alpha-N-arabinofuranosidase